MIEQRISTSVTNEKWLHDLIPALYLIAAPYGLNVIFCRIEFGGGEHICLRVTVSHDQEVIYSQIIIELLSDSQLEGQVV